MNLDMLTLPNGSTLHFRIGSQDQHVIEDVIHKNEYHLFDQLPADGVVYDIGAHIGTFTLLCLMRGCRKAICVEADPENVELLERNLAPFRERVEIYNRAVWGPLPEPTSVWLARPTPGSTAMAVATKTQPEMPTIGVKACSLDDILGPDDSPVLVKVDIEGAEYPAIYGSESIADADQIIVESHLTRAPTISEDYRRIPTPHSHAGMVSHLASRGHHVECRDGQCGGLHTMNTTIWTYSRFGNPLWAWPRKI